MWYLAAPVLHASGDGAQLTWGLLSSTCTTGTDRPNTRPSACVQGLWCLFAFLCIAAACADSAFAEAPVQLCGNLQAPGLSTKPRCDPCGRVPTLDLFDLQVKHLSQAKRCRLPQPQRTQESALRGDWSWSCSASACRQVSSCNGPAWHCMAHACCCGSDQTDAVAYIMLGDAALVQQKLLLLGIEAHRGPALLGNSLKSAMSCTCGQEHSAFMSCAALPPLPRISIPLTISCETTPTIPGPTPLIRLSAQLRFLTD